MHTDDVLEAIPSTESASFNEFCGALSDCPERGDREGWADLFQELDALEALGLVFVDRLKGRIDTLQLTEAGAAAVRERHKRL